jgi:hypothetical protein
MVLQLLAPFPVDPVLLLPLFSLPLSLAKVGTEELLFLDCRRALEAPVALV